MEIICGRFKKTKKNCDYWQCYQYGNKKYMCADRQHADICTFSFHPVKHITTGEGGAILTNDENLFTLKSSIDQIYIANITKKPEYKKIFHAKIDLKL